MKGFQERSQSNGKFFVIKHNSIVEESSKERPGFEPIEVRNPSTGETVIKFVKRYSAIEALITKIEWRDTEDKYERRYMSWKIHLDTGSEKGVLELAFESRSSSRFMKLAENLDFTEPVEFRAWKDAEDKTAFIVKQFDHSVPQKYTKENPGDCPAPKRAFGGKWNFDDQMLFLHGRMINAVIPAVDAAQAGRSMSQENGHGTGGEWNERPPDSDPPDGLIDDDIPF